jgi:hypothetical protein
MTGVVSTLAELSLLELFLPAPGLFWFCCPKAGSRRQQAQTITSKEEIRSWATFNSTASPPAEFAAAAVART